MRTSTAPGVRLNSHLSNKVTADGSRAKLTVPSIAGTGNQNTNARYGNTMHTRSGRNTTLNILGGVFAQPRVNVQNLNEESTVQIPDLAST